MRPVTSLAVLLAASFAPLVAADMHLSDLRVSAGILSPDFEGASSTTVRDSGGNIISETTGPEDGRDADDHWRAQVQYVGGHLGDGGGFVYGIGLGVNHARWDNGSQDARATSPSINLLLGYGYAFTPAWHFEITPFAGYGRTYYSVTSNGSTSTNENEWSHYVEYGAKLGTYVSLGNDLVLGVEVPYLVGRFDPDYDYDDAGDQVSVSDERRSQGFGVLLTLGGRF